MKVWTGDPRGWGPPPKRGSAVTVGVFDGVHEGHKALLTVMYQQVKALEGIERAVVTFDVHPRSVVTPEQAPRMLTTLEHRIEFLGWLGVDRVGVLPFDLIRDWPPEMFVRRVLVGAFDAKAVVVGKGFRFGAGRAGDITTLMQMEGRDFWVGSVGLFPAENGPVSSSNIRRLIAEGDVSGAADLLGRYHGLPARVPEARVPEARVPEAGRGAPRSASHTVELEIDWSLAVPAPGAYTVWAGPEKDQKPHAGVCSIGAAVELYLPDVICGLAGRDIWMMFTDRLREDPSLDDPARLKKDMARSRRLLDEADL